MKTRDCAPPVHVHVPDTTPVHVHLRRSPSRTPENKTRDGQLKGGDGGRRSKGKAPWIPPGKLTCRRGVGSQRGRTPQHSGGVVSLQLDSEEQDDELASVTRDLHMLLTEQDCIRRSNRAEGGASQRDTNLLLRALVEAEIDSMVLANQLTGLKETIDSLVKDKRLTKQQVASLREQQELLLQKIEVFDFTNRGLRKLLREWSEEERASLVLGEEKDALERRLADSETENIRLLAKLSSIEREAGKLAESLDFEKDNMKTTEELSKILEQTRDHLDSQLSRAEADKAHLNTQIQRMQQSYERQQEELKELQEELQLQTQRSEAAQELDLRDQQALVLLSQKAEQVEESARNLATKLQEKEAQLAQALSTSSDWCLRHSKEAAAKGQLEEEISALRFQVTELSSQLHLAEEKTREDRGEVREQLHRFSAENACIKMDNQRLEAQLASSEEKFRGLQTDARELNSSLRKYEILVDKYKKKLQQARLQSEEFCLQLQATQKDALEATSRLEREREQVKRELLPRLRELEVLPDKLKRAEQQLRDVQQENDARERRNLENNSALSDVRHKVEQQGSQLEAAQRRSLLLQEENNFLKEKIHSLERKLEDVMVENEEVTQALTLKDASACSIQQQLEEKSRECSVLTRQLQQTLDDAHRQVDDSVQRIMAKERASQSKALDLQSQLSRAKAELSQLQRSKEEMESRFQNQLQNLKDRLEQSDSTNRSLQSYVHFLKTSYGNVFGESVLSS